MLELKLAHTHVLRKEAHLHLKKKTEEISEVSVFALAVFCGNLATYSNPNGRIGKVIVLLSSSLISHFIYVCINFVYLQDYLTL